MLTYQEGIGSLQQVNKDKCVVFCFVLNEFIVKQNNLQNLSIIWQILNTHIINL